MQMAGVFASDPPRYRLHQCVISGVSPRLKVIAMHPNDIGEGFVARSKILSVCEGLADSILPQHGEPAACFNGIKKNRHAMCSCHVDHVISASEVSFVRR